MTEKELDKNFLETGAYKNLWKMLGKRMNRSRILENIWPSMSILKAWREV